MVQVFPHPCLEVVSLGGEEGGACRTSSRRRFQVLGEGHSSPKGAQQLRGFVISQ